MKVSKLIFLFLVGMSALYAQVENQDGIPASERQSLLQEIEEPTQEPAARDCHPCRKLDTRNVC